MRPQQQVWRDLKRIAEKEGEGMGFEATRPSRVILFWKTRWR